MESGRSDYNEILNLLDGRNLIPVWGEGDIGVLIVHRSQADHGSDVGEQSRQSPRHLRVNVEKRLGRDKAIRTTVIGRVNPWTSLPDSPPGFVSHRKHDLLCA
jgi:hypothetical protein